MLVAGHRFRAPSDKLFSREVDVLTSGARAILADPASSSAARELAEAHIEQVSSKSRSQAVWRFLMLGEDQIEYVFNWMADHSKRLRLWNRVWAQIPKHVDLKSGQLKLTREELAAKTGASVRDVSSVMSELEECGVIIRRRDRVPGLRGPGVVRYHLNSNVGTHLAGKARDAAQAKDRADVVRRAGPVLSVIDGTAHPSQRRSRAAAFVVEAL